MDDPVEARRVVESIRIGLEIDDNDELDVRGKMMQAMLNVLSDELYSKPSRFLAELIQNADDNLYPDGNIPKLSIVYRTDGFLWFGCNERGFSEANLRALCSISSSTKKIEGKKKGFIGEKGIGFKSVFKVAEVVWVKSGALSLKLDKNKPLGMVAPIWCDFNSHELVNERTMFCFRIPDQPRLLNKNPRIVVEKDIKELQAELLLFLRQLRKVDVTIEEAGGSTIFSHHLRRSDEFEHDFRITELSTSSPHEGESVSERFVVCQHTADDMPFEQKREDICESDLMMAFPIDEEFNPIVKSRQVFNFLPIRAYGLPFILQADFVLGAGREDVQVDVSWNEALISATRQLFIESVKRFNDHEMLSYSWPRYLQSLSRSEHTACEGFYDSLIKDLRLNAVLKSEASTNEKPSDLLLVRKEFTDGKKPLFSGSRGLRSFAHHSYCPEDLSVLNVRQQTSDQFHSLLQDYVKRHPEEFRQQPSEWQSRLATAILVAGADSTRGLSIVPLRTGKWVAAKGKNLSFPEITGGIAVPKGIEVDIVDDDAARDESRRKLYTLLGVGRLDEASVFELILQQHTRQQQSKCSWSAEEVVDHAWFLFRAKSFPRDFDITRLLVASRNGKLHSGRDVYMDAPDSTFPLSRFLDKTNSTVQYLHDLYYGRPYLESIDDPNGHESLKKKWLKWLEEAIGVRTVPRLAVAGGISPEFDVIVKSSKKNEWLQLLKDQWPHYALELQAGGNRKLKDYLTSTKVLCIDGQYRPLKDVYLPTARVMKEPFAKEFMPMLSVRDPEDGDWRTCGRSLQVRMDLDPNLFITVLTHMKNGSCSFKTDDVRRMYSGIAENFTRETAQEFRSKELVYIATPKPGKWVSLNVCRWKAPEAIITLYALHERYKQNAELFRHRLHLTDTTIEDIVRELTELSGCVERMGEIKELLRLLAGYVKEGKIDINNCSKLHSEKVKILPVRRGDEELSLKSFFENTWFITGEHERFLTEAFRGEVYFLDEDVLAQDGARNLFEKLGLLLRLLSRQKKVSIQTPDEGVILERETEGLRSKAEYLARLAEVARREQAMSLVRHSELYIADVIVQKQYVEIKGRRVFGRDGSGSAALQVRVGVLQIWVSKEEYEREGMPYDEFYNDLSDALGVSGSHRALLRTIISTDNRVKIERKLEEAGLGEPVHTGAFAGANSTTQSVQAAPTGLTSRAKTRPVLVTGSSHSHAIPNGFWQHRSGTNNHTNGYLAPGQHSHTNGSRPRRYDGSLNTRTPEVRRDRLVRPLMPACFRDGASSAHQGANIQVDTSHVDLSAIRATLRRGLLDEDVPGGSSFFAQYSTGNETSATRAELAVGVAGEKFVYDLLKQEVGIGDECWTSSARAEYNLEPFLGDEAEFADFTVVDPATAARFSEWLLDKTGVAAASEWLGEQKNFHIEVKTTKGGADEMFEISNNQSDLAKQWHFSRRDEMLVLRVFDIGGRPDFKVWHDLWDLKRENVLTFRAKAGFCVWPN